MAEKLRLFRSLIAGSGIKRFGKGGRGNAHLPRPPLPDPPHKNFREPPLVRIRPGRAEWSAPRHGSTPPGGEPSDPAECEEFEDIGRRRPDDEPGAKGLSSLAIRMRVRPVPEARRAAGGPTAPRRTRHPVVWRHAHHFSWLREGMALPVRGNFPSHPARRANPTRCAERTQRQGRSPDRDGGNSRAKRTQRDAPSEPNAKAEVLTETRETTASSEPNAMRRPGWVPLVACLPVLPEARGTGGQATRRIRRTQRDAPSEPNAEAEVLTEAGERTAPSEPNAPRRPSRHAAAPHPDS